MIEILKVKLIKLLKEKYPTCNIIIQEPKDFTLGDISIPLFEIAKREKKAFETCFEEIQKLIKLYELSSYIYNISLLGGYVNISLCKDCVSKYVLETILEKESDYGKSSVGLNKTVVIDYSSPNIAKPFSIGHLRSTIIGNSLGNLHEKANFKVIRINHLGDWGTQFGKLIVAYKKWGNKEEIIKDPINELVKLYIKYNELASNDEKLLNEGRVAFKKLEDGDKEYLELWNWFKDESIKEYKKMYEFLNVNFDSYSGEAFYNDKMNDVINELEKKQLLIEDLGAYIVKLDDLIPALIKKSDGSTLYLTRDLAALKYRINEYHFDKILYVVGNEQTLHFKQLKEVINKMGYDYYKDIYHINFGLVLQNGKKMSTRKGNIIKLTDVLDESINMAFNYIETKNPNLENKEQVAKDIGIGAVIFNDLKNYRENDIEFNMEQMLNFSGQTGPYLQYTSVRINSIIYSLEFSKTIKINYQLFKEPNYFDIIRLLDKFQNIIEKAVNENEPSIVAKYSLNLAQSFNSFYGIEKIIVNNKLEQNTKVTLAYCVKIVLDECLRLLGIKVIEKM